MGSKIYKTHTYIYIYMSYAKSLVGDGEQIYVKGKISIVIWDQGEYG